MKKSATFTQIIIKICYVLLAIACVYLPFVLTMSLFDSVNYFDPKLLTIPFYLVVPAGYVALIALDIIMGCVKKNEIFTGKIVKCLNALTIACVYAGTVGMVAFFVEYFACDFKIPYMLILALGECFMALICYVLKHCFAKGIEIKDENDLTI